MEALRAFYASGMTREGNPVCYFIPRNVPARTVDRDALALLVARVAHGLAGRAFELVVDAASFSAATNALPFAWAKALADTLPPDVRRALLAVHVVTTNEAALRVLSDRRLGQLLDLKAVKFFFYASAEALNELIDPLLLALPRDSPALTAPDETARFDAIAELRRKADGAVRVRDLSLALTHAHAIFRSAAKFRGADVPVVSAVPLAAIQNAALDAAVRGGFSITSFDLSEPAAVIRRLFASEFAAAIVHALNAAVARANDAPDASIARRVGGKGRRFVAAEVPALFLLASLHNVDDVDANSRGAALNIVAQLAETFSLPLPPVAASNAAAVVDPRPRAGPALARFASAACPDLAVATLAEGALRLGAAGISRRQELAEVVAPWISAAVGRSEEALEERTASRLKGVLSELAELSTDAAVARDLAPIWAEVSHHAAAAALALDGAVAEGLAARDFSRGEALAKVVALICGADGSAVRDATVRDFAERMDAAFGAVARGGGGETDVRALRLFARFLVAAAPPQGDEALHVMLFIGYHTFAVVDKALREGAHQLLTFSAHAFAATSAAGARLLELLESHTFVAARASDEPLTPHVLEALTSTLVPLLADHKSLRHFVSRAAALAANPSTLRDVRIRAAAILPPSLPFLEPLVAAQLLDVAAAPLVERPPPVGVLPASLSAVRAVVQALVAFDTRTPALFLSAQVLSGHGDPHVAAHALQAAAALLDFFARTLPTHPRPWAHVLSRAAAEMGGGESDAPLASGLGTRIALSLVKPILATTTRRFAVELLHASLRFVAAVSQSSAPPSDWLALFLAAEALEESHSIEGTVAAMLRPAPTSRAEAIRAAIEGADEGGGVEGALAVAAIILDECDSIKVTRSALSVVADIVGAYGGAPGLRGGFLRRLVLSEAEESHQLVALGARIAQKGSRVNWAALGLGGSEGSNDAAPTSAFSLTDSSFASC